METTNTTTIETAEVDNDQDERAAALAAFLECDIDDVSEASYGDNQYDAEGAEYLVLTDSEADERVAEYIKDLLWAFNPSFLAGETDIDEDVYTAIANNNKCESNNDAIMALVKSTCGIDSLVESAVSADGRGHFMSSYDGEENEQGEFFIYRTN
jgi:hypothetical protein